MLTLLLTSALLLPACVLVAAIAPLFGARAHYGTIMFITKYFLMVFAAICGLRLTINGTRDKHASVFIGNHFSNFDILVVGIAVGGVFIAGHEIRRWPVIGWFARLAGTVFINRSSMRSARETADVISRRALLGVRMVFFPEGGIRTTDGSVTAFRPMLFGSVAESKLRVQPMAIVYDRIGKQPVGLHNLKQIFWIDHPSFIRHGFRAIGHPSIHVTLHFLPAQEPPINAEKETLRAYAAAMQEMVAEVVERMV